MQSTAILKNGVVFSSITRRHDVTDISLPDYIFTRVRAGLAAGWGDKPVLVDILTGHNVKFSELEQQARRTASALSRRGFKKGDVLYFVTFEVSQLYVVQLAVWLLGGAVRGSHQFGQQAEYERQMRETNSRFVLVDVETAPMLRDAISQLEWSVELLSIGDIAIPGATSFADMLKDDGDRCPTLLDVHPREDVVLIVNTSGSTGTPKGVLHTHYSIISFLESMQNILPKDSVMQFTNTASISSLGYAIHAMCKGGTFYQVNKFKQEEYFDHIMKYKPHHLFMYPFVASWFARCSSELALVRQENFLESIFMGGWVLDHTTISLLAQELPTTFIKQLYGSSECLFMSIVQEPTSELHSCQVEGLVSVSSGKLVPFVQAKVIDPESGNTLGRKEKGEIWIKSPMSTIGYLNKGKKLNCANFDEEGWYHTGDVGFFDEYDNLYITERLSFMFKYHAKFVSPSEIESVLQEHPAVAAAGIVGIPVANNESLARAFVVLRSNFSATAKELENYVASRLAPHKQLHGGVRFIDKLPVNRGFKLDRTALKNIALKEN